MQLHPIETNLFAFFSEIDIPAIDLVAEEDVVTFTSPIAFPLFNGAVNARFEPGDAARRTHEVLDRLIGHGFPFLWWLTPNTRSPELEAVLVERGLVTEGT